MLLHRRMMGNTTNGGGSSNDGIDYAKQYFTIEAVSDDVTITFLPNYLKIHTVAYSYDNGNTWTTRNNVKMEFSISLTSGEKVLWSMFPNVENENFNSSIFSFRLEGKVNVYGNIMSLYYMNDYYGKELTINHQFAYLFTTWSAGSVVDASNLILPNNTTSYCYNSMFANNKNLIAAPKLVADYLYGSCYYYMFENCYALNYVEIYATQIEESWWGDTSYDIFNGWLDNTASSGVVKRKREFTAVDPHIPAGWTIEYLN